MKINTTDSIRNAVRSIKAMVENETHHVEDAIEGEAKHVEEIAEKDMSRLIHSLHVSTISAGKDITLTLDHAAGEVKRIVINGAITVEGLINHLRNLSAKL